MLELLTIKLNEKCNDKMKSYAPGITWFLLIAIVIYAFYCTSKGFDFGVVANPLKLGCYK